MYNATLVYEDNSGRHWFSSFFKRDVHKLKLKKEIKLEHGRPNEFIEEIHLGWFNKLKYTFSILMIYICVWDKSGTSTNRILLTKLDVSRFFLLYKVLLVLIGEYACIQNDTKLTFEENIDTGTTFITILLCTSTPSDVISSFVIYSSQTVNPLWYLDSVVKTAYKCS